ncbi:MAG: hypothetical protein RJA87_648 [Pseudomonadota bacterium]|jgi:hypothetical protein
MANRHNKTGRSASGPPFVQIHNYLLDSLAGRSLTPQAVAVYLRLACLYNGSNNGRLGLSVRAAAEHANIAKDTASRALKELSAKGFIETATKGAFSVKLKRATEWRLTNFRCDVTGSQPTKAFLKWQPAEKLAVPNDGQVGPKARTRKPDMRTTAA